MGLDGFWGHPNPNHSRILGFSSLSVLWGIFWEHFWSHLGRLGAVLGTLCPFWELFWCHFGNAVSIFGDDLVRFGKIFDAILGIACPFLGTLLVPFWGWFDVFLGRLWVPF